MALWGPKCPKLVFGAGIWELESPKLINFFIEFYLHTYVWFLWDHPFSLGMWMCWKLGTYQKSCIYTVSLNFRKRKLSSKNWYRTFGKTYCSKSLRSNHAKVEQYRANVSKGQNKFCQVGASHYIGVWSKCKLYFSRQQKGIGEWFTVLCIKLLRAVIGKLREIVPIFSNGRNRCCWVEVFEKSFFWLFDL